jgi:hypothetical protein
MKDQMYIHSVNTVDELKAGIAAAILNVKRTGYIASAKRRTVCGVYAQLHMTLTVNSFACNNFSTYV